MIFIYNKEYNEFWYLNGNTRKAFKNIRAIYLHFKNKE